ncbi:serine/threonine-protein kinase [Gemmatimonas groenlandica]|uniref:non-specific serine/threonine protein kinase n=1 Tax=Gemmatimonas groenlandica TaxID=2732249 RepID=A0A6M4IVR2_9BACT|nr:serine/threonine-protein kinase [Gemmatimonas groenlandica]QJR37819.1 serine/threonine protein kinase [Gemmatimonas groenlandica]
MSTAPIDAGALRTRLQRQLEGTYVIERELGGAGSSHVFLATEVSLDRSVVLKVLPPEFTADVDAERFRREIQFAAKLQHPHLVPLLSAALSAADGESDQVRWYSMPYIEGQTLRELLVRRGAPPYAEAIRLLREMALALAYAHARGVVHRDIKPENVLLNDGIAMISDFGVAKALDDASDAALRTGRRVTTVSTVLGTPDYMSPEQIGAAHVVDHRADLYAFGCVAYELLTGAPPFARSSLRATLAAQLAEAPVPIRQQRPELPQPIADMVMRCLAKNPAERPASAAWIIRAIEGASGTEVTAPAPAGAEPVAPSRESVAVASRTVITGIVVAVAAAAAVWMMLR